MNSGKDNPYIRSFYDHAEKNGFSRTWMFNGDNLEQYIDTAIDAYSDYALFRHLFKGRYDPELFAHMMNVDFRSRLGITAGIASSGKYESIMLAEPPKTGKTGMSDYLNVARPGDFRLLLEPIIYRLESFEKYSRENRAEFLDDNTWYVYIFATKKAYQRKGCGKKLMEELISYAGENGFRLCLETNESGNLGLYEHFGFRTVKKLLFQNTLEHYILEK